ncbi:MAG TPA: L-threonylcarbamoyladenylate synthase [Burkholderiales bacterium]|nr:L-threonylcarbamoyladenylate synthase [Burkholderiales bacterium]
MVTDEEIDKAVAILRAGGLVAFPTETVYGLGADASNPAAVRKVFAAKGRPPEHPLIVHLAAMSALKRWAREVPRAAWLLAERFWPGPLTMILKRAPHVPDVVTGGQDAVGLRVPSHPVAQRLLHAFDGGIVAPSANRFGRLSPTTAQHVREELGDAVDLVLDGGPCTVGIESTIVDLSGDRPAVLRPGHVTARQIEDTLLTPLVAPAAGAPRAPGTLASHYAPRTPLRLVGADELETFLRKEAAGIPAAVLARRSRPRDTRAVLWQVAPETPEEYAQQLYALLRRIDGAGCKLIVVESPPELPEWLAVRDRLHRAAAPQAGMEPVAEAAT